MGIVKGIDAVNSVAEVEVVANNKAGTFHPPVGKLCFIAKGYTPLTATVASNNQPSQPVQSVQPVRHPNEQCNLLVISRECRVSRMCRPSQESQSR